MKHSIEEDGKGAPKNVVSWLAEEAARPLEKDSHSAEEAGKTSAGDVGEDTA